eukprot:1149626-Pelagomonas_calceolata.AAC.5
MDALGPLHPASARDLVTVTGSNTESRAPRAGFFTEARPVASAVAGLFNNPTRLYRGVVKCQGSAQCCKTSMRKLSRAAAEKRKRIENKQCNQGLNNHCANSARQEWISTGQDLRKSIVDKTDAQMHRGDSSL